MSEWNDELIDVLGRSTCECLRCHAVFVAVARHELFCRACTDKQGKKT